MIRIRDKELETGLRNAKLELKDRARSLSAGEETNRKGNTVREADTARGFEA